MLERQDDVESGSRPAVTIAVEDWDAPDGAALRAAQRTELDARYGSDDHEPGAAPTGDSIEVFLVARGADGVAVACGGLRLLDDGGAEIKRMYVIPALRGSGVSVLVLRALEREAVLRGHSRLVLETGTAQPDAVRFYRREGYLPIPLFGAYRGSELSLCFAKELSR